MSDTADDQWSRYLADVVSRMSDPLVQIGGYSGMLALMINDLQPDAALEMIQRVQQASQDLIALRNELADKLPPAPAEPPVSPEIVDQKWRELVDRFLGAWSLPLMNVLGNAQMIEIFLEALAQRDNTPISIESGDLKLDVTPQMMLERIRMIRDGAQEMSRLKHKVYDDFDKPYSQSEKANDNGL